jgi:soluble lytic murein transglycosylase-like protein
MTVVLAVAAQLCGCSASTFENAYPIERVANPDINRVVNGALSWPAPSHVDAVVGARLFEDGPRVSAAALAITRAIMRTNPRITAIGSLYLAEMTVNAARSAGLPPEFLAATILQESAYDPFAISGAGAIGIAQFEIGTADDYGVQPLDPRSAIAGAASLLASYVHAYRAARDPYALALAAYNAGPGAVEQYSGVPPYAETREYILLINERWGRIAGYERRNARS